MEGINRIMPVNASSYPAPSAATIAAAVAAPSSATIASAVAAAVPTSAAITTIVQNNAGSPFGGTWTSLGSTTANGTLEASFTGLSGYKKYRVIVLAGVTGGSYNTAIRLNGDTNNSYIGGTSGYQNGQSGIQIYWAQTFQSQIQLSPNSLSNNQISFYVIDLDEASSGGYKIWNFKGYNRDNSGYNAYNEGLGLYSSTSAISSIQIRNTAQLWNNSAGYGFWLFGGN